MRSLVLALTLSFGFALVEDLTIENDPRQAFHIESFSFVEGGVFEGTLNDFQLMVPHDFQQPADDAYEIAFVLKRSGSEVGLKLDPEHWCFHTNWVAEEDYVVRMNDRAKWGQVTMSKTISEPGYYHLYYSNCVASTHSSFHLKTMQYNVDATGARVYLSAGLASLPAWYFAFFICFVVLSVVWIYLLKADWGNARSIHFLMLCVCVFKALQLFTETFVQYKLKTKGVHDGWSAAFYVFSFIKGMIMFSTIVLIGTGWSYLKPFLTDRDKQIMLGVIVVQALVNIATIAVDEATPGSFGGMRWRDILHVLDIICCCAILFPIVWSIKHLRAASGTDSKAARNMDRLANFRTFYILVVIYIYFTRIILFLLEALLPYTLTFLGPVFNETASLIFYGATGYLFRPQKSNPYLALNKDDDDITQAQLDEL